MYDECIQTDSHSAHTTSINNFYNTNILCVTHNKAEIIDWQNVQQAKLSNLESSDGSSIVDTPKSYLAIPVTRTQEVIFVWVKIQWHNRSWVPSKPANCAILLQKYIIGAEYWQRHYWKQIIEKQFTPNMKNSCHVRNLRADVVDGGPLAWALLKQHSLSVHSISNYTLQF
jgi:hypothetical protein